MADLTEKTLRTERKYTGKIISVDLLDIELPTRTNVEAGCSDKTIARKTIILTAAKIRIQIT